MDIKPGFTPIDTYYELMGFRLARDFYDGYFTWFLAFLGGCSLIYLLLKKDSSLRDVILYVIYLAMVMFLVFPIKTKVNLPEYAMTLEEFQEQFDDFGRHGSTVRAPRVMIWMHYLVDTMVTSGLAQLKRRAVDAQDAERLAQLLRNARIYDDGLAERYRIFLIGCYVRAQGHLYDPKKLGSENQGSPYDLNPFVNIDSRTQALYGKLIVTDHRRRAVNRDGKPFTCLDERRELAHELLQHAKNDSTHQETLRQMKELQERYKTKKRSKNWQITIDHHLFLRNVAVTNESRAFFRIAGSEVAALASAVPEYNLVDSTQNSVSNTKGFIQGAKKIVAYVVRLRTSYAQWFAHHSTVASSWYTVVNTTPYIYGFSMLFILAIFPVAACASIIPWGWLALFKWGKYILWIKLWVLFWQVLADMNEARAYWTDNWAYDGPATDSTYMFAGIVALYYMVPGIGLIVMIIMDVRSVTISAPIGVQGAGGGGGGAGHNAHKIVDAVSASANPQNMASNMKNYVTGNDRYRSSDDDAQDAVKAVGMAAKFL